MSSRYPQTIHITQELADAIDIELDPALISNRPGGGNTTQSFLKVDIIADQLNAVFGPLGWGVVAKIHQMDDWEETKKVTKNNQPTDVTLHAVMVISDVTLTIKKLTPDGTDTIFTEPGTGYGEVEQGKNRKEAYGMAIKGAATDGLKRCATLLGKRFGMMMASNGSQDDLEYAHNGKAANLRTARDMRRKANDGAGRANGQIRDDSAGRAGDRQEPRREAATRQDQPRQDQPRQDQRREAPTQKDDRTDARSREDARPADTARDSDRNGSASAANSGDRKGEPVQQRQESADTGKDGPARDPHAGNEQTKPASDKPKPNTNYALDTLPITKTEQTDFGATLVARITEMRQPNDRLGLVKQHLNTIKNLDSSIKRRVFERLKEQGVDVDKITA